MAPPVIEVADLAVEYGHGRKAVRAVDGISFRVQAGECVGFIGANGAGKSTTLKVLMGFLFPTAGQAEVFGARAGTPASRQRIGYLPEVAVYYPFMKARELLELYGGLSGLSRADLRERIPPLLEKVGLGGKGEVLLRQFSKGMQQRLGIAQSLIADPEALILDELNSGLDPLGRHDLRRVLLDLKRRGRTILFSSHELTEVEALCDRVIMIHRGRIVTEATVTDLMKPLHEYEIVFEAPGDGLPEEIRALGPESDGGIWRLVLSDVERHAEALSTLSRHGLEVRRTASRSRSLEQHFIDLVRAEPSPR